MYTGDEEGSPHAVGPVAVEAIPGKGRGLVATSKLSTGDLVLASSAVALVLGVKDAIPDTDDLVRTLKYEELTPDQKQWMQVLRACISTADAADSAAQESPSSEELQQLNQLLHAPAAAERNGAPSTASDASTSSRLQMEEADLERLVGACCYGEAYDDLAVGALRREVPQSFVGLWPPFALLNHSCAPNTVQMVVGSTLLVRTVQPLQAGEELTVSYLGAARFAPLGVRRRVLQKWYGFECRCPRCELEEKHFWSANSSSDTPWWSKWVGRGARALVDAWDRYANNWEGLVARAGEMEEGEVAAVLKEAAGHLKRVEKELARARLSPKEQHWMRASALCLYRLHQQLPAALEQARRIRLEGGSSSSSSGSGTSSADMEAAAVASRQVVEGCDSVARGSDLHMFLALDHLRRADLWYGEGSEEYQEAEKLCYLAHIARYGLVQPQLLRRLMLMRRRYVVGSGIAARLGLYRWEEGGDRVVSAQRGAMQRELEAYLKQVDPGWVEKMKGDAAA